MRSTTPTKTVPESPPAIFPVIGLVASAGGLRALGLVLSAFPADFEAAFLVVQHLAPHHKSWLSEILGRRSALDVQEARHGEPILPGRIHVAPPGKHLLVQEDGSIGLSVEQKVHFVRPSANVLFESAAAVLRDRFIAVVLTGTGTDGASGLAVVRRMGGRVIVQDRASAEFPGMPLAAEQTGDYDLILPLEDIPAALERLVRKGRVA